MSNARRKPKTFLEIAQEQAGEQRRRHRELGYVAEGERLSFIAGNWSQVCPQLQCIKGTHWYAQAYEQYKKQFIAEYNRLLAEEQAAKHAKDVSRDTSTQKV